MERTIRISQINIAMENPHSPERYVELFKKAKKSNHLISLRGTEAGKLGPMDFRRAEGKSGYITGDIYRFINIDKDAQWFNTAKNEPATEEETKEINIPEELRPNLRIIEFVFKIKNHKLFFVNKDRNNTLSPLMAESFFQQLFDKVCLDHRFPSVNVTAVPDKESIEKIFSISKLKKIEIKLTRPNPDDFEAEERRFLKKLERQKAKRIEETLIAMPGQSLTPDEDTKKLARVASQNGVVIGYGKDSSGKAVKESTKDKPLDLPYTVNSAFELSSDVLLRVADEKVN
jgi:hypothetical protein